MAGLQRRVDSCRRGSGNQCKLRRRLSRLRHRERVRIRNECHRLITALVREHGLIPIEDLRVRNMTRSASGTFEKPGANVRAKSALNRSILSQLWSITRSQLRYKCECYGRDLVVVDPRHTSQTCTRGGIVDASSRNGTRYGCGNCVLRMDDGHYAAINILDRALTAAVVGIPPGLAAD